VYNLQIGCGDHPIQVPGWLNVDLNPCHPIIGRMDATQPFPFPDNHFDRVFSEHMIEHVSRAGGQSMLRECFRVLRPGGRIRISCPDRQFITDLTGGLQLSELALRYVEWARPHFGLPHATAVGRNLETGFGHQFIYDRATLAEALEEAGFTRVTWHRIMESDDPELRGLEHESRMPPGFLQLETMTAEADKP
jgi:SAM-dependent methyltransferase